MKRFYIRFVFKIQVRPLAANVKITDDIASELALQTFRVVNASHPYIAEFDENGKLEVKFVSIFLILHDK